MEPENRPNAALINREWYESAKGVLNEPQIASLCVHAVEYVLYGRDTLRRDNAVGMVFAMIKPALDSDIVKYRERCARNAANARSGRERVGASGSQSQPVGATTTTTTTTTTNTTPSISQVEQDQREIEREKWLIYGYFWSTGSKAIVQECDAFWSYYEALGWKNNKGAVIVSKIAAARMWRRQFESGTAPNGAEVWYKAVQSCPILDYGVWNCYAGAEKIDDAIDIRLRCSEQFLQGLEKALPELKKSLQGLLRAPEVAIVRV